MWSRPVSIRVVCHNIFSQPESLGGLRLDLGGLQKELDSINKEKETLEKEKDRPG